MKIKYLLNKDKRVKQFNKLILTKYPKLLLEKKPDIYLVAGGDGAMLHAIHQTIDTHIPYIGKALGTFNFLLNKIEDDQKFIEDILNDKVKITTFKTNAIQTYLDGKELGQAVNDILIGDKITGYYTLNITNKNKYFTNFEIKGSGLCISTAIGSTAFNYNNGGQILPLDSSLLSITGIVCNKYLNDIVPFEEIEIKANGPSIYLSNVYAGKLEEGSTLTIKKGSEVEIAFLNKDSFIEKRVEISHRFRR